MALCIANSRLAFVAQSHVASCHLWSLLDGQDREECVAFFGVLSKSSDEGPVVAVPVKKY